MHIALIMAILWFGIWVPEFLVRFARAYINTLDKFDHVVHYEVVAEFESNRENFDREIIGKLISLKPKLQIYFSILLLLVILYASLANVFADVNVFIVTFSFFLMIPTLGVLAYRMITIKVGSGVVFMRTYNSKRTLLKSAPQRAVAFGCLNLVMFFAIFVAAARVGGFIYGK